jgi:transposase-like protein
MSVDADNASRVSEELGREAVGLLRASRAPRELAQSLGVSEQTLRNWRAELVVDALQMGSPGASPIAD